MVAMTSRRRVPGRGPLPWLWIVLGVAVVGTSAYLLGGGAIPVPFSDPPRVWALARGAAAAGPPAGTVPVPVSARTIPAYAKVTRDDVIDRVRGAIAVRHLPPDQLGDDVYRDLGFLGRVLDHDKPAGYVFTKSDFLPPDTRSGLTAGIPPGKRALRVEAGRVRGLFGLLAGDRFDVVSTVKVDARTAGRELAEFGGIFGPQLALQASLSNYKAQARVTTIVSDGVVVLPQHVREEPFTTTSISQGTVTRTRPVQEVVIAVEPEEVAPLTEALAIEAELSCVPRSGRPDDPQDSVVPDSRPTLPLGSAFGAGAGAAEGGLGVVEIIEGGERRLVPVPVAPRPDRDDR